MKKESFGEHFLLSLRANNQLFMFLHEAVLVSAFSATVLTLAISKNWKKYSSIIPFALLMYIVLLVNTAIICLVYRTKKKFTMQSTPWGDVIFNEKEKRRKMTYPDV